MVGVPFLAGRMSRIRFLPLLVLGYFGLQMAFRRAWIEPPASGKRLTIMTFNTYREGRYVKDGKNKILKHIRAKNPDFVALQEIQTTEFLDNLVQDLGEGWNHIGRIHPTHPDTAVLSKHKILEYSNREETATGAKINVQFEDGSSEIVNVWSLHLDHNSYGAYAACDKKTDDELLKGERNHDKTEPVGRIQNVESIMKHENFTRDLKDGEELMLVAGDMNSPSHRDWIEAAKHLHCNRTFQWPAPKMLEDAELADAYRQLYPDPVKNPGNTWSTTMKKMQYNNTADEPQDRMDMVFYKSTSWSPVSAELYSGNKRIKHYPNSVYNDWPSDHYSVIVVFKKSY